MIATKDPAVAVAENLWEALRSGFLGTEKTIVEIIKARAWEPLGYETFTDAWVKEVADISIANELLPHVVYQMFAEGLTVDEVAETVKGIGADRAESLDRQRRHGIPAHAASMYEVRRHMRRRPRPADTIHVVVGPAVLQDCHRIATQVGRSVEDIAKEAIMARFAELGAVGAAAVDSPRRWLPARPSCSGGVGGTRRVCRSWSSFRVEGLLDSPLRIPDKVLQD